MLLFKSGGTWKTTTPHVKVSGAWKQAYQIHVKQHGVWKPLWSYAWETGGWSACSTSCGGGTQTRTVTCRRSDNVTVPDAYCNAIAKPPASQSCNTQDCYTYAWYTGSYDAACSAYCGSGTKSRSVYCRRNDGTQVGDAYCSGAKPAASMSCTSSCRWSYGSYGSCSASCGNGTRTRSATCQSNRTGSYASITSSYCTSNLGGASTSTSCTGCSGCSFNESSYVLHKVQHVNAIAYEGRTNWTTSQVRASMADLGCTPLQHFNKYGKSEGVCPWSSSVCCSQSGYRYY